jgi:hypothetical protein
MKNNGVGQRPSAVFMGVVLALASGCAYEAADGEDEEALAAVSEAISGAAAVGVIPIDSGLYGIGTTCPRESTSVFSFTSELVTIYMDDEDDDNQTKFSDGWVPPSTVDRGSARFWPANGNTTLRFCRVEGSNFKAKTSVAGDTANFYAVLSLGTDCPTNSMRVGYFIDNEDNANENWSDGSVWPNESDRADSSTTLWFCVFRSAASTMASFPNLGAPYAVFHTWDTSKQPTWVMAKHSHYSDDEDDRNLNRVMPGQDAGAVAELKKMIGLSTNTTYSMSQVR